MVLTDAVDASFHRHLYIQLSISLDKEFFVGIFAQAYRRVRQAKVTQQGAKRRRKMPSSGFANTA
jgi:hypothetical protein